MKLTGKQVSCQTTNQKYKQRFPLSKIKGRQKYRRAAGRCGSGKIPVLLQRLKKCLQF